MESIFFSFNIVAPVFLMGAIGYFLKIKCYLSENFMKEATGLCFDLLLPMVLFRSIYTADLSKAGDSRLFWYCFLGNILVVVLASMIVPIFIKDKGRIGAVVQAVFRSNVMLVGFSILENTYGKSGTDCAAFLIAPVISMFTIASVIVFTIFSENDNKKINLKELFFRIIKNHYIIALIAALCCVFLKVKLPGFIFKTVGFLADTATPLALLMLGGQFSFDSAMKNIKCSVITSLFRLVVVPFIFVTGGILLGYTGPELLTILVLFGTSCAVSCSVMAMRMEGDYQLAGEITFISTFLSVFTLFIFIAALRFANML